MSLAFYASPIDFSKNEKLNQKLKDSKKNKLDLNALKELTPTKRRTSFKHS